MDEYIILITMTKQYWYRWYTRQNGKIWFGFITIPIIFLNIIYKKKLDIDNIIIRTTHG